ncbi:hypothetical protein GW17_00033008 [Ensete ventricosum]|nr:hypothetical protein GW17_00033008 [Ensete ventricosum]
MASSSVPQGRPETERPQVLLLRPPSAALDEVLSARFELLKSWESPLPLDRFLATHAADVRALLVINLFTVDGALLDALPTLRFVCTTSAGVNHIDLAECARRGIAVANAGTVFSQEVAEYAVGLLIDVLRRVSACDRYVRRGLWPRGGDYPLGSKVWFHPPVLPLCFYIFLVLLRLGCAPLDAPAWMCNSIYYCSEALAGFYTKA